MENQEGVMLIRHQNDPRKGADFIRTIVEVLVYHGRLSRSS